MTRSSQLLLASASPRRHELLASLGVPFTVHDADIDEARRPGETPVEYVGRMAREKAIAGAAAMAPAGPTLGADTVVLLEREILHKPVDRAAARRMLSSLSGRCHDVLTGVALRHPDGRLEARLNRTVVEFAAIPDAWIAAYSRLDEPMDKAGAYAIQGLAAQWVRRIEGSYSGVMGLPLFETAELLRSAGFSLAGETP
jgi:septum formation protein